MFETEKVREVEVKKGEESTEIISPVTRVTEPMAGQVHIHTPGSGYRIVDEDDVVRDEKV